MRIAEGVGSKWLGLLRTLFFVPSISEGSLLVKVSFGSVASVSPLLDYVRSIPSLKQPTLCHGSGSSHTGQ